MADRPFHETIVDAIGQIRNCDAACAFAKLIIKTKIPKNHDAIAEAWHALMKARSAWASSYSIISQVPERLMRKKQEAEEEARQKQAAEFAEIASGARSDCN